MGLEAIEVQRAAATRQKAGSVLYTAPALGPRPPGGAGNAPASTGVAAVMVAFRRAMDAKLSHEAAAPSHAGNNKAVKTRYVISKPSYT